MLNITSGSQSPPLSGYHKWMSPKLMVVTQWQLFSLPNMFNLSEGWQVIKKNSCHFLCLFTPLKIVCFASLFIIMTL